MKYRIDIPNEKRNILLVGLFSIFFLVLAFTCTGQIKRGCTSDGSVYKCMQVPLVFNGGISINISADSIVDNNYDITLISKISKNSTGKPYNVRIGFSDGSFELFKPEIYDEKDNYAVFSVTEKAYYKMKHTKFDYLCFETEYEKYPCTTIKRPTFFADFLNNYNK